MYSSFESRNTMLSWGEALMLPRYLGQPKCPWMQPNTTSKQTPEMQQHVNTPIAKSTFNHSNVSSTCWERSFTRTSSLWLSLSKKEACLLAWSALSCRRWISCKHTPGANITPQQDTFLSRGITACADMPGEPNCSQSYAPKVKLQMFQNQKPHSLVLLWCML